jgi:ribosome-binding protein aMBF1 (putative translation factor)
MELSYKNYRKKLGQAIERKRKEKDLSREALASRIDDVCMKTIERIEKADYPRDLGLHTIQAVCKELDFPIKLALGK